MTSLTSLGAVVCPNQGAGKKAAGKKVVPAEATPADGEEVPAQAQLPSGDTAALNRMLGVMRHQSSSKHNGPAEQKQMA